MAFFPGAFSARPGWLIYRIGENGFDYSRQAAALAPRRHKLNLEMEISPGEWQCRIKEIPGFLWSRKCDFSPAENHPADEKQIAGGFSSGVPLPWQVEKCRITFSGEKFFLPGAVLKSLRRSFWEEAAGVLKNYDPDGEKKRLFAEFSASLNEKKENGSLVPEVENSFEIPGFISESDLPLWEKKVADALKQGVRRFKAGGFHALELLKNAPQITLTSAFPISVTNSQCAALLKELNFSAGAISPEVPEKTLSQLLSRSPLGLFKPAEKVPLLVSRAKIAPSGIWKERTGAELRLDFDDREKLWKLWKK
jgi:putative protease